MLLTLLFHCKECLSYSLGTFFFGEAQLNANGSLAISLERKTYMKVKACTQRTFQAGLRLNSQ